MTTAAPTRTRTLRSDLSRAARSSVDAADVIVGAAVHVGGISAARVRSLASAAPTLAELRAAVRSVDRARLVALLPTVSSGRQSAAARRHAFLLLLAPLDHALLLFPIAVSIAATWWFWFLANGAFDGALTLTSIEGITSLCGWSAGAGAVGLLAGVFLFGESRRAAVSRSDK
ncbi:hypothetical protein [Leifsonia sp. Leaf264]|uniref:hypothetical protein n=1 Tax=Leifsonia sp. Leaf264 TaxID=1736314 RepID=UPI0006FBB557|nr:hypothetical protein [Leifsonia sp. Leaf264]KQO98688.1 hypothetical protein ASF30_11540 [Leifsonia sp. Leaf264]